MTDRSEPDWSLIAPTREESWRSGETVTLASGYGTYSSGEAAKSSAATDLCASETGRTAEERGATVAATRSRRKARGGSLQAMAEVAGGAGRRGEGEERGLGDWADGSGQICLRLREGDD